MATSTEVTPGRTANLCTRCRGLEVLGTEGFCVLDFEDEWPALSGLKQSAAGGCGFCSMICSSMISGPDPDSPRVRIVIRPLRVTQSAPYPISLRIFMGRPTAMSDFLMDHPRLVMPNELIRGTFLLCKHSSDDIVPMFSAPTTQVLSERNVDFIQSFIAESTASVETVAMDLPTRLLDLADFELGRAKLVLSAGIVHPEKVEYAALSYCWGSDAIAKSQSITTFSNQEDRKAGFRIKDLSPVIQDAIQVCSRISIRYLWVDALCILQPGTPPTGKDDKRAAREDWDKESQHLWVTFRGAYITICAASSTSCQDSFLQNRRTQAGLVITSCSAAVGENSTSSTGFCEFPAYEIRPWPKKELDGELKWPDNPFHSIIYDSRWYSRGWVHQEISFSRRLLVFGTNMVLMRCGELQACENGWRSSSNSSRFHLYEVDLRVLHKYPFSHFADEVRVFYDKQITNETDRLPALAGLANQVASLTGSEYLAGLWRDNLASDLLFCVSSARGLSFNERLRELSAPESQARPSWSWAGHRRRYKHRPGYDGDSLSPASGQGWILDCVVIEAVAEAEGANPFGAVKHAHLSLLCRVIALEELFPFEPSEVKWSEILRKGFTTYLKGLHTQWDTNNDAAPVNCTAKILFICTSERPDNNGVGGLIIYPAEDGGYYRIGTWNYWPDRNGNVGSCIDNHRDWESRTIKLW